MITDNLIRNSFICLLVLYQATIVSGQKLVETIKLFPETKQENVRFGHGISISGNYAIIGNFRETIRDLDNFERERAGAAYIYKKEDNSWTLKQRLTNTTIKVRDDFGVSVSIEGDIAIIGVRGEDIEKNGSTSNTGIGVVHVYKRNPETDNWDFFQQIEPPLGVGSQFGFPVKLKDGIIYGVSLLARYIPGFPESSITRTGAVLVYERDQANGLWQFKQQIHATRPQQNANFGKDLDIFENRMIVGSPNEDRDFIGAAYILEKNTQGIWEHVQRVEATTRHEDDNFGEAVALNGKSVIVCASSKDVDIALGGIDSTTDERHGAFYAFELNDGGEWEEVQFGFLEDRTFRDGFGETISMVENTFFIGANRTTFGPDFYSGAIYQYEYEASTRKWIQKHQYFPEERNSSKEFGVELVYDGTSIIVADIEEDFQKPDGTWVSRVGSVHIFEPPNNVIEETPENPTVPEEPTMEPSEPDMSSESQEENDNTNEDIPQPSNGLQEGNNDNTEENENQNINFGDSNPVEEFKLFPNPFKEEITFIGKKSEKMNLKLYDLYGRLLIQANKVSINNYKFIPVVSSGVYILQVDITNQESKYIKVIKQ